MWFIHQTGPIILLLYLVFFPRFIMFFVYFDRIIPWDKNRLFSLLFFYFIRILIDLFGLLGIVSWMLDRSESGFTLILLISFHIKTIGCFTAKYNWISRWPYHLTIWLAFLRNCFLKLFIAILFIVLQKIGTFQICIKRFLLWFCFYSGKFNRSWNYFIYDVS